MKTCKTARPVEDLKEEKKKEEENKLSYFSIILHLQEDSTQNYIYQKLRQRWT